MRRRWHTWHKEELKIHICIDTITLDAASICMSVHSWNSSIGQWSPNSRKRNTLKTREQPGVTHRVGRNVHRLKKCHEADTTKNERNHADERRTRHADRKKKMETAVNREEQIQQQFTLTLSEYLLSCALESFSIREKPRGSTNKPAMFARNIFRGLPWLRWWTHTFWKLTMGFKATQK